jgi:hypothetical protein
MSEIVKDNDVMERKIISISKKRQITIPLKYYKHLKNQTKILSNNK